MGFIDSDHFFNFNEDNASFEKLIKKSNRRIKEKEEKIEDLKNELDLLKNQALMYYKKYLYYNIPATGNVITSAQQWLQMLESGRDSDGKKLDKRKKYEEKITYNNLNQQLSDLLHRYIHITSIIDYNYGQATIIEFESEDDKWKLKVPIIKSINTEIFDREGEDCFKLQLTHIESKNYGRVIGSTFLEEELGEIIDNCGTIIDILD